MGLFGHKKVSVTVHGNTSLAGGADGRYSKQARKNKKAERKKIKRLVLEPRTTAELCGYIEAAYGVKPLPSEDEIVKEAAEQLADWAPLSLTVYNLVVMQGSKTAAWLQVYVEDNHDYLAFKPVSLECEDDYSVRQVIADIVKYFGAGKEDQKARNERYIQFLSVD